MPLSGITEDGTVACRGCGQIHDEATALIRQLREDLGNAERDLRGFRSRLTRAQGDSLKKLSASPHYDTAMRVLHFWKANLSPRAKELGGKRLQHVIDRLQGGYTENDLNLAVLGYGAYPYVVDGRRQRTGPPDARYVDAELIFRGPKQVDQGHRLFQRASLEAGGDSEFLPAE